MKIKNIYRLKTPEVIFTCNRPSIAAGPLSAICKTNKAIFWNSLPPRILNPKPLVPLLSSTAWYWVSSPSPDPSAIPSPSSTSYKINSTKCILKSNKQVSTKNPHSSKCRGVRILKFQVSKQLDSLKKLNRVLSLRTNKKNAKIII